MGRYSGKEALSGPHIAATPQGRAWGSTVVLAGGCETPGVCSGVPRDLGTPASWGESRDTTRVAAPGEGGQRGPDWRRRHLGDVPAPKLLVRSLTWRHGGRPPTALGGVSCTSVTTEPSYSYRASRGSVKHSLGITRQHPLSSPLQWEQLEEAAWPARWPLTVGPPCSA